MSDNLPEINFKEKKEKKGGALGWLRGRLGFGSRGAMGEAGINPSAMNVGRALGTAKFGASSGGFAALLAGKASTIAAIAMVAVASGVYLTKNAPAPAVATGSFTAAKTDNYVPAIQRSQAANNESSLEMFKDTNKGAGLAMEAAPPPAAKQPEAKPAAAENAQGADQAAPGQDGTAQDMMAKLQGGAMGSMTSSLGGGSNKFSAMGGFGNKFGQGTTGAKAGFSSGIGSGFSGMPKFDQRKGKLLAMKGAARPVFGGSKAVGKGKFGAGSLNQAKGMRAMQKTFSANDTSADKARATQDAAWTGATGEGNAGAGGTGLSDGGAGIVTSPSLDNAGNSGNSGGADSDVNADSQLPVLPPVNQSPWTGLVNRLVSMLTIAATLAAIGSALVKVANAMSAAVFAGVAAQAIRIAGYAMCVAAMALGATIIIQAMSLISQYGQALLGSVFMIGGACAITAGGMGMAGAFGMVATFNSLWMGAATGVIGLIGSMMGGK